MRKLFTNRLLAKALALGGGLLAAGCTVYAPMQPVMPLVRQRGELEAGASCQPTGRLEATAAYSPLRRAVLTAALTAAPKLGGERFLVTRQAELGAGAYQPLGSDWLLSATGGYGLAYCHRGYVDLGIFGPGTYSEYTARYHKYFGQVGLAHVGALGTVGFTYRLAKVRFNYLESLEEGPLPLPGMLRHELAYFVRLSTSKRWQVAFTTGVSVSGTAKLNDDLGYPTYGRAEYHANRNLLPAFFMSLGATFR